MEQLRKQFLMDAATRSSIIHNALKDHLIDLEGLCSFYNASTSVTRKAFATFIVPTLKTRPGVQAFEWIPRVAYPERARFEAEARRDGLQDYQIYQLDPKGNKVAVGPHQYYYPVYYVEPLAGNEPALGFDLGSNPARLAALDQAADTGRPVATERITLVQETGSQAGFLIFIPVYRQEMPLTTAEQRNIALQGFVLGVFRAGDAVEAAVRPSPEKGLWTELVDLYGPLEARLLYRFEREPLPLKVVTWKTLLAPTVALRYEYPFYYAGRQWRVDIIASPAYVQGHISLSYWLTPPIGVLLALSLALYFGGLLSHKERAENLVAVRTAELVQANEMMQAEITKRQRAEEAVQEGNETLRALLNAIPESIFLLSTGGVIVAANETSAKRFGKGLDELIGSKMSELIPSEVVKRRKAYTDEAIRTGRAVYFEDMRDGMCLYSLLSPIINAEGKVSKLAVFSLDITERKQMEEALRKAEERYRSIFENAIEGIFQSTPGGIYIGANTAMAKMFGYESPEDLMADISDIKKQVYVDPQRRVEFMRLLESDGFVKDFEYEVFRKDTSTFWISENARSVKDEKGEIYCYEGFMQDITAHKQAEETLRSTRDYLENIFANSADVIVIVDRKGKFTRWNKAAEEIYGYTFEELKGKPAFDLYADSGELDAMLKQLRQHDFIRNYEINMKKKDGSVFPATLSIRVLRNSHNEIIGSVTVSRDLSETKWMMTHLKNEIHQHEQARQAMLDSEQKLVNIIDFLPDATFVIDTKGKVIAWNKAIQEMTGVKAKDMVGKDNYEYALPFYGERGPILIDLVLEPDGIEKYEEVKREDWALMAVAHLDNFRGKETYLFGKASALIDLHGNIIGSIESIRDITDLRKAETDRLQFSKLESMSILAGGIAHDFNNILMAILGNIGLAMLDGNIAPQVRERLAQSEQACLRAQALSRQLLTFAKGGAPIKKFVSIANLLIESASLTLSGSKSRCEMSIPDDLWSVAADTAQINQVISNLLINADQAMPEGGIIKITAENISINAKSNLPISKGKYVKLAIADQGVGISPKYLDKIFDPYFSTKQKGSGLGLATAYSIIKNHSGHIQVESRMGVGTTFYIYLPAANKRVPAAEPETVKPVMGQGKVLVMDDEEMVREVLDRMLSLLGYEVDFATDGSQAIEKFIKAKEANQPFAAVILDLTIPGGMGGKEAMERLLKIDPQVKAIVSSGYSDDPIMADFQKYGFVGVIAKPYKVVELGNVLNKALTEVQ